MSGDPEKDGLAKSGPGKGWSTKGGGKGLSKEGWSKEGKGPPGAGEAERTELRSSLDPGIHKKSENKTRIEDVAR